MSTIHPDPIRLLYVRDTLSVCGPGKTILSTIRTIDRCRFHLTVAATAPAAGSRNVFLDSVHRLAAADAIALAIGRGVDLMAVWKLVRLIREREIDILQTHDAQTRRIGVLAAAMTGVRHITSVHGWIFNERKERAAKWLDARLIRLADAVIAVSGRLRDDLRAAGVAEHKITVLKNAILLEDYAQLPAAAAARQALSLAIGQPVVSIVGRLSPEKGHEVFLRAARIVASEIRDARFLIIGDGPLETGLRALVRTMGLEAHVLFTGHQSTLAAFYAATDVLVISSFTEGIPNVLLEAFAFGKPAVATEVGGVPEVLRDGVDGWLVQPGDHEAIAARVLTLLKDRELRERMGRAGRTAIETDFDFVKRTRALERLYAHPSASAAASVHQHAR